MAKAKAKVKSKARAKAKPAGKRASKASPVDFSEADSVKAAMSKVLDVSPEDIDISASHYEDFGTGYSYWKLEVGRQEYHVAESESTAYDLAVAVVKQDLEESPENFNQSFIEGHIDKDHLRDELMSDVENNSLEWLQEEAQRDSLAFMKENNLDVPSPSKKALNDAAENAEAYEKLLGMDPEDQWAEIGEEPEVPDSEIEKLAEEEAKLKLQDPVAYLEDIYGREEAIKQAIKIGGIDEEEAAKEAVGGDGIGHFLGHYDNDIHDGPDGIVYWRTN